MSLDTSKRIRKRSKTVQILCCYLTAHHPRKVSLRCSAVECYCREECRNQRERKTFRIENVESGRSVVTNDFGSFKSFLWCVGKWKERNYMTAFEYLASMVSSLDPWWLIASALALIIGELLLMGTSDAGLIIACSLIFVALLSFMGASGNMQIWAFPIGLFGGYFAQRKFFHAITGEGKGADNPYEKKSFVGKQGTLIVSESTNESENYFFDYKKSMAGEGEHQVEVVKSYKVLLEHAHKGEIYPAIDETGLLKNGQLVEEKWLRLFEQNSPIYKWNPSGLVWAKRSQC